MTKARDLGDNAQNTKPKVVNAKADLIVGTGSDAADRLAVGSNGETLVADSSTSTGLRWQGNFAAGKNLVINGDFRINQRNFSSVTTTQYGFDRFYFETAGGTVTHSAQTFTPGTAPVAGYEGINFARIQTTSHSAAGDYTVYYPVLEDARNLAGQVATVSFWAKAASGTPKVAFEFNQTFGTGGSPSSAVNTYVGQATLSTSWARYSFTFTVPSVSGKTFGTNNNSKNELHIWVSAGSNFNSRTGTLGVQNNTFDFWGVQFEAGNTATAFQTATGTLAGELATCQRYYQTYSRIGNAALGACWATDAAYAVANFFCQMRVAPTITFAATGTGSNQIRFLTSNGGNPGTVGTIAAQDITTDGFRIAGTGFTSAFTIGNCSVLFAGGTTATTIYTASAEL